MIPQANKICGKATLVVNVLVFINDILARL